MMNLLYSLIFLFFLSSPKRYSFQLFLCCYIRRRAKKKRKIISYKNKTKKKTVTRRAEEKITKELNQQIPHDVFSNEYNISYHLPFIYIMYLFRDLLP
jgi:hypothetical protein